MKLYFIKNFFITYLLSYKPSKIFFFLKKKKIFFSVSRNFIKRSFKKFFNFYKKSLFGMNINVFLYKTIYNNKYINKKQIIKNIILEIFLIFKKLNFYNK